MQILVLGNKQHQEEFKLKFSRNHTFMFEHDIENIDPKVINKTDIVFDFFVDEFPDNLQFYIDNKNIVVFCNVPKTSLGMLSYYHPDSKCTLLGFNGLPSMLNRQYLEVSVLNDHCVPVLEKVCKELETEFLRVDDRVGMVTPRVMCMIINEAFYTVQERTASEEDIDLGMKLGTNYPMGPFEMCKKIGLKNVYELLEALYEDTKDERYKICPLLKRKYLMEASY
jgi:3-hydroxybutyryl-CoA dehydrogenase